MAPTRKEIVFQLCQLEARLDIRLGDLPAAQIVRDAYREIEKAHKFIRDEHSLRSDEQCVCGYCLQADAFSEHGKPPA